MTTVKGDNRRLARVGDAIREELSSMLIKSAADPRLRWVTITGVDMSPDLRNARVFYVVTGNMQPNDEAARGLSKAASFLQSELAGKLKLRYVPKLSFHFDKSFDEAVHIDALIEEVKVEREAKPKLSPEKELAKLIAEAEKILVITHRNPDGDAVGSLLGFSRILSLMGKKPTVYCPDKIPKVLSFLSGANDAVLELEEDASFELTVSLDTAEQGLLPPGLPPKDKMGTFAVIDHHSSHKEMGDLVIRYEASSVGEMIFDLQKRLVWPIDKEAAECLYTSIVSDTGSFQYSNTKADTHRAAAELIQLGARSWQVATALFESYPLKRQKLLAEVLTTLFVNKDGRYARLICTVDMLKKTGASKEDLDSIINYARSIDTVQIAAMFREESNGDVKVSFRSKGEADVAAICEEFGGGGHKNAAGCTIKQTSIEKAIELVDPVATKRLL